MEIIYRAKDGKEFEDEYECEKYERKLRETELFKTGIIFLDYYNEKVNSPIYESEKIYHIYFPTEESIKFFKQVYEEENDSIIDKLILVEEIKPNIWYHFDDFEDSYFSYERKIKEFQEEIEKYDDIFKKINQEVK